MEEDVETPEVQRTSNDKRLANILPHQFKKGQSGNPGGKKKGTVSLKKFAQNYIQELTDEEKLEFMEGINKKDVWEMAEGKAKQDIEADVNLTSKIINIDE